VGDYPQALSDWNPVLFMHPAMARPNVHHLSDRSWQQKNSNWINMI
jgi:hypothetical protein